MKKRAIIVFIFCGVFLFNPNVVLAHPGRTDSNGCHKCNTNCAKWGLDTGEYHCHNGNTYTNSRGQTFNSDGNLLSDDSSSDGDFTISTPKSSDNTLKTVTVDGENIEISNQMNYKTKNEKINILVETNDSRASYNIDDQTLNVGVNIINIKVTAENGDVKNYKLVVNREKLSSNTNIKIVVDDDEINFTLGKADIDVSSDAKNLNYKYELEDENSKVVVDGDKDLKSGENLVTFTVIAEDGTEVKYELKVNKYTKTDEVLSSVLGFATMGCVGYGAYCFAKKRQKR